MQLKRKYWLPKPIRAWIKDALYNDKGYSDRQVWRIEEWLDGRWNTFNNAIRNRQLFIERQGDRYRLATIKTQQLSLGQNVTHYN